MVNKNEKEVFKKPVYVTATKNNVVECSFEWNAGYSEVYLLQIIFPKKTGGLAKVLEQHYTVINKYTADKNSKKNKITLSGEI